MKRKTSRQMDKGFQISAQTAGRSWIMFACSLSARCIALLYFPSQFHILLLHFRLAILAICCRAGQFARIAIIFLYIATAVYHSSFILGSPLRVNDINCFIERDGTFLLFLF